MDVYAVINILAAFTFGFSSNKCFRNLGEELFKTCLVIHVVLHTLTLLFEVFHIMTALTVININSACQIYLMSYKKKSYF